VGYIKELDRSSSNSSDSESEERIKTTKDMYENKEDSSWMFSLKKEYKQQKQRQMNVLDKRYFRMKTTATNILIKNMANEKSLDTQNKSDFNKNSNFYLDYFGQMRIKMINKSVSMCFEEEKSNENLILNTEPPQNFQKKVFQRFNKIKNINALKLDKNNRMLQANSHMNLQISEPNKNKGPETNLPVLKTFDKNKFKEIAKEKENVQNLKNNSKNFRIVTKKNGSDKRQVKIIVE